MVGCQWLWALLSPCRTQQFGLSQPLGAGKWGLHSTTWKCDKGWIILETGGCNTTSLTQPRPLASYHKLPRMGQIVTSFPRGEEGSRNLCGMGLRNSSLHKDSCAGGGGVGRSLPNYSAVSVSWVWKETFDSSLPAPWSCSVGSEWGRTGAESIYVEMLFLFNVFSGTSVAFWCLVPPQAQSHWLQSSEPRASAFPKN